VALDFGSSEAGAAALGTAHCFDISFLLPVDRNLCKRNHFCRITPPIAQRRRRASKTDQKLMGSRFILMRGRTTMPEQFENPEVIKLEDETVSMAGAQKRIERVAEKAAERPSRTEHEFDQDHQIISK
jgi:hypothetical protein